MAVVSTPGQLNGMRLVLASSSPRRRQLLAMVGACFEVDPPAVDENFPDGLSPEQGAVALACAKADQVARRRPDDVVVGADTLVVLDGDVLGKPRDADEARRMLQRLSGRTHEVWTGLAVRHRSRGRSAEGAECTRVTFRELDPGEIERYVALGEGMDKAGAYAVQGVGAIFVVRIEGCYYNVVGLPLARLAGMLRPFGVRLW